MAPVVVRPEKDSKNASVIVRFGLSALKGTGQSAIDDVIAERHAVMSYAHMLDRLRNERVKEVIARILEDEKLHLEAFTRLLAKLSD